jgi:hypothetical protein
MSHVINSAWPRGLTQVLNRVWVTCKECELPTLYHNCLARHAVLVPCGHVHLPDWGVCWKPWWWGA